MSNVVCKIDDEFKRLCPPLSQAERGALEQSIIAEGCREALVLWDGIIVDGHNRYEICTKNKVQFRTIDKQFDSRDDVKRWMLQNQIGRRNLSTVQASYLRGTLYRMVRNPVGGGRPKKGKSLDTQSLLAEQFGVCKSVIRGDVQVADAIDCMCLEARDFVLEKEVTARKQHIIDLSQLSADLQRMVVEKVKGQEIPNLANAILRLRPTAIRTTHSVRCKTCGARLAPGVVVCLKCDLDESDIRERLSDQSQATGQEVPDDYEQRLSALRASKESGDEVSYYADWLINYLGKHDIYRNTKAHKRLSVLTRTLNEKLNRSTARPIHAAS